MLRASLLLLAVLVVTVTSMGFVVQDDECKEEFRCPKGYRLFPKRKNGAWCMKVVPGNLTWWEAERECRCTIKGGTLSGIESTEEKKYVEETVQDLFDKKHIENGAVWIGAYRRKECPSGKESLWSKNAKCGTEKMFQFTDRHSCGTYIFQDWADDQPTSAAGDDCGVLLVSTESEGHNADQSGKAADKNCLQTNGPTPLFNSVGFVCGVKPAGSSSSSYYGSGNGGGFVVIGAGKPDKQ